MANDHDESAGPVGPDGQERVIERRAVLGGAALGAVAWTAPKIVSQTAAPAFSAPPPPPP